MRRLVVAVIAVLMVLPMAGCGGGGDEEATPAQAPPAQTAPVAQANEENEGALDATPPEPQKYELFPSGEEAAPQEIANRLDTDEPMIVYFFDSSQRTTNDQDAEISAVLKKYRGLIDLVKYDVGRFLSTDETGTITVQPSTALQEGKADENALKVARLISPQYLDVTFTPYIVIVDEHGYITHRFRGFTTAKQLEQEVLRATD